MKYFNFILLSILMVTYNASSILAYPNEPKTVNKNNTGIQLQPQSWNWSFVGTPLGDKKVEGILVDPADDNIWYVSTIEQGLYITRNGGTTWEHPLSGRGMDIEGYQIDPINPNKLYATLWDKLFVSDDKGLTWTNLYTCPEYIRSLHISTVNGSIYLGPQTGENNNPGIYKSTDGGNSFEHCPFGVSTHNLLCWDIEEDPKSGTLFVSIEISDHPQPYNPPFFRSTDYGSTWQDIAVPNFWWHALKMQVDTTNQKLYYQFEGGRLYKSDNLGNDWQISDFYAMFILLNQQHQNQLYAGHSATYGDGGAWFSGDSGEWFMRIGLDDLTVVSLAMNGLGTKLYAACYDSGIWVTEIPQDIGELTITNTKDSGTNSLREVLQLANVNPGADTIRFAIPTSDSGYNASTGTWTFQPRDELPNIMDDSLFIDGTSQNSFIGYDANPNGPEIIINGTQSSLYANGLHVFSSNNVISNIVINGFNDWRGIWISGSQEQGNTISGCYIGTDHSGTQAVPNHTGIYVDESSNNIIGGNTPEARNIISGNWTLGINCLGEQAGGNHILGNYIGLTANGTNVLGSQNIGIYIQNNGNIIGGSKVGEGNIISGNGYDGIYIIGNRNIVKGNYIGTDITGSIAYGNGDSGIYVNGAHNSIGGINPRDCNLISGNKQIGINITNGDYNQVAGNLIGTDIKGQDSLGNARSGITLYYGAQHNIIGPDNIIAYNYMGVQVASDSSFGNTITENSIFNNTSTGIAIVGGNNNINSPNITSLSHSSVVGTALANATVEIFSDEFDEGKIFEGKVTADGNGDFNWVGSATGPRITTTATDADSNTSGFSSYVWLTTIKENSQEQLPETLTLEQNYPNPFNATATIRYSIPDKTEVQIIINNVLGEHIKTLYRGVQPAGRYSVKWDASEVPTGVYLIQLISDKQSLIKKCLLMK